MRARQGVVLPLAAVAIARAAAAQCSDGTPPPCGARRSSPAPTSVAILYFENLTRDSADAYLPEGLTEEITSRLGALDRLQVKSRSAVRRFRGRALDDLERVGRVLQVRYVVEGSVRRYGPMVRVSVRLVRTADGFRVWGADYDRASADLLALQEEIAGNVAGGIAGHLMPAERASLAGRPTRNPDAFDHFLRGNHFLARRTPRDVSIAIEEYETAVRLDPQFAAALGRIAFGYGLVRAWGWGYPGLTPESTLARGLAAADRAVQLDARGSDGWMAMGILRSYKETRLFTGATEALERALALDQRNAEAHHTYGTLLGYLGRDSAEAVEYHRALRLDPTRTATLVQLALWSLRGPRLAEARAWLDSAVAVEPDSYYALATRALVRVHLGDASGARDDARRALQLSPPDFPLWAEAAMAIVEARTADTTSARARVDRLLAEQRNPIGTHQAWWIGSALVALGDRRGALDYLERVQPRGARLWDDLRRPEFDPIRSDVRFRRWQEDTRPRLER